MNKNVLIAVVLLFVGKNYSADHSYTYAPHIFDQEQRPCVKYVSNHLSEDEKARLKKEGEEEVRRFMEGVYQVWHVGKYIPVVALGAACASMINGPYGLVLGVKDLVLGGVLCFSTKTAIAYGATGGAFLGLWRGPVDYKNGKKLKENEERIKLLERQAKELTELNVLDQRNELSKKIKEELLHAPSSNANTLPSSLDLQPLGNARKGFLTEDYPSS